MKKSIATFLIFTIAGLFNLASASTMDVKPSAPDQLSFLEIKNSTVAQETYVSFIYHRYPNDKGTPVGPKRVYSLRELQELRTSENWDIFISSAADLGVVALTFFTGALAETAIAAASGATGGAYIPLIGATVGLTGGIAIDHYVDMLNPIVQYDQANSLRDDVLLDREVVLQTDGDIKKFVESLSQALSNLKP